MHKLIPPPHTCSHLCSLVFSDLELHRVIGTGQFGAVRLVRSKVTNEVFALKVGASLVMR